MSSDEYLTIAGESSGIFRDRGSKFIALCYRCTTIEEVELCLGRARKEYRDARHHCYAYKLGMDDNSWRVNDDGEPSGSAGKPILGQIASFDLTNILIVVVRYFGGTLLGVGGLIVAYRSAARDAIENNRIIKEQVKLQVSIYFPYASMNDVMKIIKEEKLEQSNQVFEMDCSIDLSFRQMLKEKVLERFAKVEGLKLILPS